MKIKKVLLIKPRTKLHKEIRDFGVGEPLGLLYIASNLKKEGYTVNILNASCSENKEIDRDYIIYGMKFEDIKRDIIKFNPDIIGLQWFTSSDEDEVIKICELIKKIKKDILIIVGGIYPTISPENG